MPDDVWTWGDVGDRRQTLVVPFSELAEKAIARYGRSHGWMTAFAKHAGVAHNTVYHWQRVGRAPASVLDKIASFPHYDPASRPSRPPPAPLPKVPFPEFKEAVKTAIDGAYSWVAAFCRATGLSRSTVETWRVDGLAPLYAMRAAEAMKTSSIVDVRALKREIVRK